MKIGYLNATNSNAKIATSVRTLVAHGVESTQVLNQTQKSDWAEFEKFLSETKVGDIVVIHSLFDFCVSIKDLFRFAALTRSTGIIVQSASEPWFDTSRAENSQADYLAHVEQFYFDCIARQTKKGLDRARRNGKKIGRRVGSRKITDEQLSMAYRDYYKNGVTMADSCMQHSVSPSTLYRYMKFNSLPTRS